MAELQTFLHRMIGKESVENSTDDVKPLQHFRYVNKIVGIGLLVQEHTSSMISCDCHVCTEGSNCRKEILDHEDAYKENGRLKDDIRHIIECEFSCPCGIKCENRVTQRPSIPICVFKEKISGFGVKSPEDIQAGQFIGKYAGEVLTSKTALFTNTKFVISSWLYGNVPRFLNHGCEPNFRAAYLTDCFPDPRNWYLRWVQWNA